MAARIFALLFLSLTAASCVTAATSAVTETASIGVQERSVSEASSDARLHLLISDKLFQYNVDVFRFTDLTIVEGRVLLTGNVPTAAARAKAEAVTWEVAGVKDVINELQVRDDTGIGNYAHDSWIVAKLRTQMVFARHIKSINYEIDSVNGTVYVMGVAQDQGELSQVVDLARATQGVKDVLTFVRLKSELPNPLITGKPKT